MVGTLLKARSIGEPDGQDPRTVPITAPRTPTTSPFARTTSETFLLVAPIEASMPSERCRRWASTVKPPIAISAMRSIPIVSTARDRVSGLIVLSATEAGVDTLEPRLPKGPQAAHGSPIELGCHPRCVEEHGDVVRGLHLSGQNEGELVEEALWVLDDANHPPRRCLRLSRCRRPSS